MPVFLKKKNDVNPNSSSFDVSNVVKSAIDDIRILGDTAIRKYSERFDRWSPQSFELSKAQIDEIVAQVPAQTIQDIKEVQANVKTFALAQRNSIKDFELEMHPGIHLGQKNIPINSVGA